MVRLDPSSRARPVAATNAARSCPSFCEAAERIAAAPRADLFRPVMLHRAGDRSTALATRALHFGTMSVAT